MLVSISAIAQKTIKELADLSDKKFDKITSSTVNTYGPNVLSLAKTYKKKDFPIPNDLTPKLNRVGLATFFLVDNNWVEPSKKLTKKLSSIT